MNRALCLPAIAGLLCTNAAVALAQAAPADVSARWGGAIFVGGAVVLLGLGAALSFPGWNRLGIALWTLLMTAGGCLAIYAMQGAAIGEKWQLPAFCAGMLLFIGVGDWALRRLKRA